jgi:hypothetical protein
MALRESSQIEDRKCFLSHIVGVGRLIELFSFRTVYPVQHSWGRPTYGRGDKGEMVGQHIYCSNSG